MNLPNLLSLFRLILVPVFPLVFFSTIPGARYWAALVYAVAFVTDLLDGYLARRFDQVTRLGRVLDPLADKLMTGAVVISIAAAGIIPWWCVAVLVVKEVSMGLGAAFMYRRTDDVIPANYLGKASTGFFFIVCALLVLFPAIPAQVATVLITLALGLTVAALLVYMVRFLQLVKSRENGQKSK